MRRRHKLNALSNARPTLHPFRPLGLPQYNYSALCVQFTIAKEEILNKQTQFENGERFQKNSIKYRFVTISFDQSTMTFSLKVLESSIGFYAFFKYFANWENADIPMLSKFVIFFLFPNTASR